MILLKLFTEFFKLDLFAVGGGIATMGEILPSFIIVTLVSKSLEKFNNNKQINSIFYGLRPAVTGLIAAAGFDVLKIALFKAAPASSSFLSIIS